jgi:hypothetical protein
MCEGEWTIARHVRDVASQRSRELRLGRWTALRRNDTHQDAVCAGKINLNVLPLPTSLLTSIRPPWASTIRRAMYLGAQALKLTKSLRAIEL